eukprot:c27380_g1_i1 orf=199-2280(+)
MREWSKIELVKMAEASRDLILQYVHSPVHYAVARRDYTALRRIISSLPTLAVPGEISTEAESIAEEKRADKVSAVIDRRDVPGRITPLHLAVRLGDSRAAEILMAAGANWSLQNEQGWSALQEAICARENTVARVIVKHYQRLAWLKWCRRLPRLIAVMRRMEDFYMELTFHFQSSLIPFIGRIAPSDTYKIWKLGSNLRADMTLSGFDGFKIQRSDQSVLFLGEGSADGKLPPGYLCMLKHKNKEVMNAMERANAQPSEVEIAREVVAMSQTNMYRPGIDVTQAELVPQWTWRRQEKTEMVGPWKSKIYEMQHVMVSLKSKRVPGALTSHDFFRSTYVDREDGGLEGHHGERLTEDERHKLERTLSCMLMENGGFPDGKQQDFNWKHDKGSLPDLRLNSAAAILDGGGSFTEKIPRSISDKKWWFKWSRRDLKHADGRVNPPQRNSVCIDKETSEFFVGHHNCGARKVQTLERTRRSVASMPSAFGDSDGFLFRKDLCARMSVSEEEIRKSRVILSNDGSSETEYRKGLRPVLWLTESFPLGTQELLPLLDILGNNVKAVRRLREVLTTKMPPGTFPVKISIPVVPTIQVIVTFTRFDEFSSTDEFSTPLSSPDQMQDVEDKIEDESQEPSDFLPSWIKDFPNKLSKISSGRHNHPEDITDLFTIPNDYIWTSFNGKRHHKKDKRTKGMKGN